MTCIVGLVASDRVYAGADSCCIGGDGDLSELTVPKLTARDGVIFACTGSLRYLQVMQHAFKVPRHRPGMSDFGYMVTDFAEAVSNTAHRYGATVEQDGDRIIAGNMLVGISVQSPAAANAPFDMIIVASIVHSRIIEKQLRDANPAPSPLILAAHQSRLGRSC